jgi:RHS repeat-associated protein
MVGRKAAIWSVLILIILSELFFAKTGAAFVIPVVKQSVKPIDLSRPPLDEEIMAAGQLGGQLYPTHEINDKKKKDEINLSFGRAIQEWNKHNYRYAVSMFREHVERYPDSPWTAEAILHIGCDAQYNGRYSEAEASFRWIIDKFNDSSHPGAKMLVDKAMLRLGNQMVLQNNLGSAAELFANLKEYGSDWRERTYASHWINRISKYKKNHLAMLNCGSRALAQILEKDGKNSEAREIAGTFPLSGKGHNMEDLRTIAARYGYSVSGFHLSADELEDIPLPAIVQLSGRNKGDSGHYWILEEAKDSSLKLSDPQSRRIFYLSPEEFLKEWSGNALLFTDKEDLPWKKLAEVEMNSIYGGCCGVPRPEDDLGCPEDKCKQGPGVSGGTPTGEPVWTVNMVNMNLYVTDTPLWYESPIGPSVEISLHYNSQSAIAHNEPFGNKWQFNYASYLVMDTGGEVTIFMPDGRRDVYTPNGYGGYTPPFKKYNTLVRIADNHFQLKFPEGGMYIYTIPPGTSSLQPFLVEIRDAYGQKLTMSYDINVRLTKIYDALNRQTTLTYNSDGLITQIADPFGRAAAFQYDSDRNLTGITDMGGYSTYLTYDEDVYITGIQRGEGLWKFFIEPADGIYNDFFAYPAPGEEMWENYRITIENPLGGKEEYHYDGYSSFGWYVSPNHYLDFEDYDVNNSSYEVPKTIYEYHYYSDDPGSRGEINLIATAEGNAIVFVYDSRGNVSITESGLGGDTSFYSYGYNDFGRVTSVMDPYNTTAMEYASNNVDLVRVSNGLGEILLEYNNSHDITKITDRLGKVITFAYNQYGQMTSSTDPQGIATNYSYGSDHLLAGISRGGQTLAAYTYDPKGRVRTYTNAVGITLTYDYNNLNDITKITFPDGKYITISYSGSIPHLITAITDRAGRTFQYTYNAIRRLTQSVNPEEGITRLIRDANGNMVQLIDPEGNVTSITYDHDNRPLKKIFADGTSFQFSYEYSRGRISSFTNARNIVSNYTYDLNNNLLEITYSDSTPPVSYTYDNFNRRTSMQDGTGTHSYSYDANSRLISVDGPLENDLITFQYDNKGRMTGRALEGGQSTTYTYDVLDRLTSIQNGSNGFTYTYSGASPLVRKLTRPNLSFTDYEYDTIARLTGITNKTSAGAVINQYLYGYNIQDLRSTETITNGIPMTTFYDEAITYNYNNVNQLLSSTSPDRTYAYDEDGNMIKGYTPEGYSFDASYDAENRLIAIQYSDGTGNLFKTEYAYMGTGILAEKKEFINGSLTGNTRYVVYGTLPLQERDGSNNVVREYTWGLNLGGGIGGLLNLNQAGQDYSYLYDGKGNVTALINFVQSVAVAYNYDPFGYRLAKTGALNQPYQFSTKQYDSRTGLSYYGYRFYSSEIGRWMTRDPIGEAGGINLYEFVKNNPANWVDPMGLEPYADENARWEEWKRRFPESPNEVPKPKKDGPIDTAIKYWKKKFENLCKKPEDLLDYIPKSGPVPMPANPSDVLKEGKKNMEEWFNKTRTSTGEGLE